MYFYQIQISQNKIKAIQKLILEQCLTETANRKTVPEHGRGIFRAPMNRRVEKRRNRKNTGF